MNLDLLEHAGVLVWAGWIGVVAAGVVSFAGLVGLRFQSRGSTRFQASGPAVAFCTLPLSLGIGFSAYALGGVFRVLDALGEGLGAAAAAGFVEALSPLLLGLVLSAALAACAFLLTAVGSGRTSATPARGLVGWGFLASTSVSFVLALGAAFVVLWVASSASRPAPPGMGTLRTWQGVALVAGFALAAIAFAEATAGFFVTPRGPSSLGLKVAALMTLAGCGLFTAATSALTWTSATRLERTASTGLRDGEAAPPEREVDTRPDPGLPTPSTLPPEAFPPPEPVPLPAGSRSPSRRVVRAAGGAVRVGGAIPEPRRIRYVPPSYPDVAKQARVQGVVILEATIGERGDVTSVKVLRGIPLLDASAIEAVKQWVYEPTWLNGLPVPVIMTVTVNYRLS
jgi:protein TonB